MADKSEVARLTSLAHLDADAVGAYDVAISRIGPALVRERLNSFRADHLRHVQDLNTLIRDLGGEPVALRSDLKGSAMKGLTAMTGLMGTEATLWAMLGNEELFDRAYELALQFEWTPAVKVLIRQHREDERRHGTWIRDAVRTRPWAEARASFLEGAEVGA
ncbi:ferritin-like domain-containing protein [Corallococcus sicarius]|uniref:Ferritin-like domain-containing protein n=1 Tax=Corallococcus sicarius TaxID=2316726 RepID=A0A3A8N4R4_9BACT|nr:ferritin-like domain-containing protein [Corallococcus sicarius]RKH39387.1 ferritin-like domain-containing protein [Corallococcus sicarius]